MELSLSRMSAMPFLARKVPWPCSQERLELLLDPVFDGALHDPEHQRQVDEDADLPVRDPDLPLRALCGAARGVERDDVALPLPDEPELLFHAARELLRLLLGLVLRQ